MKFVVYAIAMLCTAAGFSQEHDNAYFANGNTCMVYNNTKDTIRLSKMNGDSLISLYPQVCNCPTHYGGLRLPGYHTAKIFKKCQINGTGGKEVIVKRSFIGSVGQHGGTFDVAVHEAFDVYEIWDLDSKALLFRFLPFYEYEYDCYCNGTDAKGLSSYLYNFSIDDDDGTVTISGLDFKNIDDLPIYPEKEGIYTFKNGKYSKQ
jgi:hypothetical protein